MRRIFTTLLLLAGFALPAAAQTATSACSAISVGDLGALNGWVPSPNDLWHQDVSGLPVDANSNKIMTTAGDLANRYLHPDFSNVNDGAAGIPYTIIDSANVPFVPITAEDWSDSDNTLYPITATTLIEGSPGQCWNDGADHHAIIIDRTTCAAYEIYQADLCGGQWTSYGNVIWDFTLPAGEKRPYGVSSVDAAGLSVFEGLLRYDEIAAGQINHAIRFTANHTKADNADGYFTAPATHAAGTLWGTDNIIGMRIRLKASFDISAFSPTNQIILTAMKKYGMILADNGADMFFQGTPDPRWDDNEISALKAVPSSAFEVVQMNPVYDAYTAPSGPAPTISSFTASADSVAPGTAVTLTPAVSNGSYEFVDIAGFTRGPITVNPTVTTTYTLYSRNEYDTSSASVTVTVADNGSHLAFNPIAGQTYGSAPFAVSVTSLSSGAVTYSVVSGPATLSGNMVTLTGTGTVSLQASQVAAGSYPAASVVTSFSVAAAPINLAFTPIGTQVVGAPPLQLSVTTNSKDVITYLVVSGPAQISGNLCTVTGPGVVTLEAAQGNDPAHPVATAFISFNVVNGISPGLAFNAIGNQTFGNPSFPVSATSRSSAPISYTVISGPASLSGSVVTLTGVGPVTLQASQPALGTYTAASVTTSFVITGIAPTLTFNPVSGRAFGSSPFAISATSNSGGAITYSVLSGPATISGSTVTLTGAGTVTLQASQAAAAGYTSATANTSFVVTGTAPTLSFNAIGNQTFGAGPLTVSAVSNSTGAITYSVLSGPATLSGSTVTFTGAGSVTLQAAQAAAGGYTAATVTTSFNVAAIAPTLAFNSVGAQTFGGAPFGVSATSNSTGTITYSVVSGPATISGSTVAVTGTGTVILQASQAAAGGFSAAAANTSFNVTGAATTLSFSPVANQTMGAAPFAVSATSNSSGAISYAVLNGPATINGNVVTLTGVGTVTLQASQAATANYSAATAAIAFNVTGAGPTLVFNQVPNKTFGAAPFTVSATSNSTGAITYAVISGPATVSGTTVTLAAPGTVVLQASQAASGSYVAAAVTCSFSVGDANPGLTFNPIANQTFSAVPFAVSASSNSSGAINYTVLSGPATLAGNVVTLTGAGAVTLQASQAAVTGYTAATVATSFNISAQTATLTFQPIGDHTFGGAPFAVAASSNSTGVISYTVLSGPATIVGNVVTPTAAGAVVLQANQAAANGFAATSANTSFNVTALIPTLAFNPIAGQNFGGAPFGVASSSNSPGAITYTVLSGPATLAGNIITLTGAGSVTLQASQAAAPGYAAATALTSFNVTALTPNITFTSIANQSFGSSPFAVAATSNSPGAITYMVISGPATLSGSIITLTGAGTVTLQASQAAAAGYAAASALSSFNVTALSPSLSVNAIGSRTFGAAPFTVSANSNSTGVISYSVVNGPATINGNTITLGGAGLVTVQASQAANGGYGAATALTTFTINPAVPSLSINNIPAQIFGGSPIAVSAASNSTGATTWSVISGPAVMVGGSMGFTAAGPVTLQVTQAAAGNFQAATATTSFTVSPAVPNLTIASIPTQTFGAGPLTVSAISNSATPITYTVVSGPATISGTTVTLTGAGGITLQATQPASGNYLAGATTLSFTVAPSSVVLAGDFAMPNNITITINQGDSKNVLVPLSALNGFNGLVAFRCTVPTAMTFGVCSTTAAQLTSPNATNGTITVSTKGQTKTAAENRTSPLKPTTTGLVFLGCMLPCGLPFLRRRKINLRRLSLGLLLMLGMGAVSLTTTGCGAMILNPLTPAGTYVLNVNATSGSSAHAMTITVIVQPPTN